MKFSPLLVIPAAVLVIIALVVFMLPSKQGPAMPEAADAGMQATTTSDATPSDEDAATGPVSEGSKPDALEPSGYTMAEVSAHADASSCWTAINGSVYDLTAWITEHPGGKKAILGLCGTDGTEAFMGQHGGQGRPEQELASFKIGALI